LPVTYPNLAIFWLKKQKLLIMGLSRNTYFCHARENGHPEIPYFTGFPLPVFTGTSFAGMTTCYFKTFCDSAIIGVRLVIWKPYSIGDLILVAFTDYSI
jgi:hypothetical protein